MQAYMYLLLGNSHMESNNFECAIQSFEDALAMMPYYVGPRLVAISLVRFLSVGQRLSEALHAAGHMKEESKSFLEMVNTFHGGLYKRIHYRVDCW